MNRKTNFALPAIGAVAASAVVALTAGCHGSAPLAAVVNGEPITLDQYYQYLQLKPQVQVIVDPQRLQSGPNGVPQQPYVGAVVGSLGLQALSDLVQQDLVKQMARDENVYPSPKQINDEMDSRNKTNPTFVKDLVAAGFSLDMIRNDLAVNLCQFNLTTEGVTVSDDEVTKYIAGHPEEFKVPQGVDMLWVLVNDDKTKKAADADLKGGSSFEDVASKYSTWNDRVKYQNHFPTQAVPQLAAFGSGLMEAVKKTPEQQQTDWIKFRDGWAKFYINKKSDERNVPIDDALKAKVKKALMLQKGSQAKDLSARIRQRLKDGAQKKTIEIKIDNLKQSWQTSIDSLVNGATPTVPGGTGGTTTGK